MKRYLILFLFLSSWAALAQDKPPALLFEAAQCLATDPHHWVDTSGQTLQMAYHTDSRTFAGSKYVSVIVFTTPERDKGRFFDIRYKDEEHHRLYSIENNADFASTPKGLTFSEPPLGGNWTQNQLTPTIQHMLKQRKWYEAEMKYLLKPNNHILCQSNVEDVANPPSTPQPKPQPK